ncbi:uncharacterized protein F5147DRAFT_748650 [Suillus discolor]|uniref:CobW/HypB/UreG nucleotide-binding domain-containing protein n=1 Tax=Suillus discolor TaxID=1912936 RepID=A0A9P7JLK1_9AGAM|nr:uncharacterized protein F5147DRAFT_748650 [Suillus discolor]KAG2086024.1 hypothetical protein F5147DRAFT_748650 [Suillus discolor]
MANNHHIPITIFTGFLGAGKTSIILSLFPLLPKCRLNNRLTAVSEILNVCMCCILVDKYRPDRIIIECSLIREFERQTNNDLQLDAIVTVIDAKNFTRYEDTSPTAKMQASYSDIILIIKCNDRNGVDPNVLFGIDSKLFRDLIPQGIENHHHERIMHLTYEVEDVDKGMLESALASLSKESVWRVKGFIPLDSAIWILNWAFSTSTTSPIIRGAPKYDVAITMGEI